MRANRSRPSSLKGRWVSSGAGRIAIVPRPGVPNDEQVHYLVLQSTWSLDAQFALHGGNLRLEADGVLGIAGRGRQPGHARRQESFQRPHRQLAEILRGHRGQRRRQVRFGLAWKRISTRRSGRAEPIDALLPRLAVDFDERLGKTLHQKRQVAIAAAVLVAEDEHRPAGQRRRAARPQVANVARDNSSALRAAVSNRALNWAGKIARLCTFSNRTLAAEKAACKHGASDSNSAASASRGTLHGRRHSRRRSAAIRRGFRRKQRPDFLAVRGQWPSKAKAAHKPRSNKRSPLPD